MSAHVRHCIFGFVRACVRVSVCWNTSVYLESLSSDLPIIQVVACDFTQFVLYADFRVSTFVAELRAFSPWFTLGFPCLFDTCPYSVS